MRVNEKNIVLQNRFKSHEAILLANILKNQLFERTLQLILHALKQTNQNGNKFKNKTKGNNDNRKCDDNYGQQNN